MLLFTNYFVSLGINMVSGGINHMKHALLLVGPKVLAGCGRSPQLPTADTLLLILLTRSLCNLQVNDDGKYMYLTLPDL